MPKRPDLPPEEQHIAELLAHIYAGATVEQYDDNSADSMFDLRVTGPLSAAVEVGIITDRVIREALAAWRKKMTDHTTERLSRTWIFNIGETSAGDQATSFPRIRPPNTARLTAILERLEARGIDHIGHLAKYMRPQPGGWDFSDPDIKDLFVMLGVAAEHAMSADAKAVGRPGGWQFAISYGHASTDDPNSLSATLSDVLNGPHLDDLRRKLKASGLANRIAALVFDSSTNAGWSTSHWEHDSMPTVPVELPDEVTGVLVSGMNQLVVTFDRDAGWRRYHMPTAD